MYTSSLTSIRVKGSECFRIESGVRHIMFLWLINVYIEAVMKNKKMEMERMGVRFLEEGRELILPGLLYADDLVLCGKSELDLKVMVAFCRGM